MYDKCIDASSKKSHPPIPNKKIKLNSFSAIAKISKFVNYTHPENMSKKLSAIVISSLVEA